MAEPVVKNAADENQVKAAKAKDKYRRNRELEDVRVLLTLPEGRRFLWRCLGKAKVFESIWVSSAQIHYNSGMQDFGHFLMAEIVASDPDAFLAMMKENKEPDPTPPAEEKEAEEMKEKEK